MVKRCVASGCNIKAKQKFMLFCFPKESNRRAKWISFVNQLNWQPSTNSALCELHFDEDQWEQQRVDGSRKLKSSAIPSLQCSIKNSSLVPMQSNYCCLLDPLATDVLSSEISETPEISENLEVTETSKTLEISKIQLSNMPVLDSTRDESISVLKEQLCLKEKEFAALQSEHHSLQKMVNSTFVNYCYIKKQYKSVVKKLKRLQELHDKYEFGTRLREDQRIGLCLKSVKGRKWSTATIIDGLTYKTKWGTQDYTDFVKRFPIFPSVRTLQRASVHLS